MDKEIKITIRSTDSFKSVVEQYHTALKAAGLMETLTLHPIKPFSRIDHLMLRLRVYAMIVRLKIARRG